MRMIWIFCGFLALGLGLVGAVLPLLPTVPFFLLAAFCFARSSVRLHEWLLTHKTFGPPITDWHQGGVIRRKAKVIASLSIIAAFCLPLWLGVKAPILAVQFVVLCVVAGFIWSRPES